LCSVPCSRDQKGRQLPGPPLSAIHNAGYKSKVNHSAQDLLNMCGFGKQNSDWEEHNHSTEGMIAHLGEYTVLEYLVEVVRKNGVKAVGKICTHKQ